MLGRKTGSHTNAYGVRPGLTCMAMTPFRAFLTESG